MTMIELLVSLALLAVLTGFLAAGLVMGRRAFGADRLASAGIETAASIRAVSALIGSALPVPSTAEGQSATIAFDGRAEVMSFIGLSEGHALHGGPHRFNLRRNGGDVVVDAASMAAGASREWRPEPAVNAVVLTGVRAVRFAYFGRAKRGADPAWRTEWFGFDHLPDLVSVQIDFEDERRNEPAVLVALRQG